MYDFSVIKLQYLKYVLLFIVNRLIPQYRQTINDGRCMHVNYTRILFIFCNQNLQFSVKEDSVVFPMFSNKEYMIIFPMFQLKKTW